MNLAKVDLPQAYVRGRDVRWNQVCLRIPDRFAPLGSFNFSLTESAGTRTIFAEKNANEVISMIVVQNEHMTSDKDLYDYPLRPGIDVGGVPLRINVFAASDTLSARRSPSAETALTMQFLQTEGFHAPDEWLKVRYATYDATGTNEFLVFYMEPLDTDKLDLAALGPSDFASFTEAFDRVRKHAATILTFRICQ